MKRNQKTRLNHFVKEQRELGKLALKSLKAKHINVTCLPNHFMQFDYNDKLSISAVTVRQRAMKAYSSYFFEYDMFNKLSAYNTNGQMIFFLNIFKEDGYYSAILFNITHRIPIFNAVIAAKGFSDVWHTQAMNHITYMSDTEKINKSVANLHVLDGVDIVIPRFYTPQSKLADIHIKYDI